MPHDETLGVGDAYLRPDVGVAALDELLEAVGGEPRGDGVSRGRGELRDVTGQRPPLHGVMGADVDDERWGHRIVDEVVTDPLGLPRITLGFIAPQAGAEHTLR